MKKPLLENSPRLKRFTSLKFLGLYCGILTYLSLTIAGISYLIFVSNEKWYLNATQTTCKIIGHDITDDTCNVGESNYQCYNGHAIYDYIVSGKKYHKNEIVILRELDKTEVKKELEQYPIGSKHVCWYEITNPKDVTLIEENNYPNYLNAIIFSVLGLFTLILACTTCGLYSYVNYVG